MELTFLLLVVLICAGALAGLLLLYGKLYERHINKALLAPSPRRMIAPRALAVWIPAVLLLAGLGVYALDVTFDISQRRLTTKEEILENARIGYEDFTSQISMSGDVAAVLSYPADLSEAEYRVYLNSNSNHPDYVYRTGGDITAIERGVCLLEDRGTFIFLSLNTPRIAEIRCENGTSYTVDPNEPFVLVIPEAGSLLRETRDDVTYYLGYTGVTVYDENGTILDLTGLDWFELRKIR